MIHNKLVRDKILDIIQNEKKVFTFHIADAEEYTEKLKMKLQEEVQEFLDSEKVEELADIIEVIHSIAKNHGISIQELEKIREKKAEIRGSFTKRFILEEVKE